MSVLIDLDILVQDKNARRAIERYFAAGMPDDESLMKELRMNQSELDSLLAYLVKKTISEDDGRMKSIQILGSLGPLSQEETERGKPETTSG